MIEECSSEWPMKPEVPPITAADIAAQAAMFLDVLDQAQDAGEEPDDALRRFFPDMVMPWTFVCELRFLAATATVEHIAPEDAG